MLPSELLLKHHRICTARSRDFRPGRNPPAGSCGNIPPSTPIHATRGHEDRVCELQQGGQARTCCVRAIHGDSSKGKAWRTGCMSCDIALCGQMWASLTGTGLQVPGSVLWMLTKASVAPLLSANLRRECALHGVHPSRLVFAPSYVPLPSIPTMCAQLAACELLVVMCEHVSLLVLFLVCASASVWSKSNTCEGMHTVTCSWMPLWCVVYRFALRMRRRRRARVCVYVRVTRLTTIRVAHQMNLPDVCMNASVRCPLDSHRRPSSRAPCIDARRGTVAVVRCACVYCLVAAAQQRGDRVEWCLCVVFISRVASSLLHNLNTPTMVVRSAKEFVETAGEGGCRIAALP